MAKKNRFQSTTGMHDILSGDQRYFQRIYEVVSKIANFYQFQKIDTPLLEPTEIFTKGVGLTTDIVEKQMYSFKTRGGDYVTMRPEGTAPIARAYIEHGMQNQPQPIKLWYFGPFFRYEHPQSGRYRQFWQFGFEILGEESAVIDAQIIQIFYNILNELKLKNLMIEINSIGDSQCRPYYKKLLTNYLKSRESSLCADCKRRLKENPLRILDCKEEKCQPVKAQAPQIIDHLCEPCHKHFKEVLEYLDEIELPYALNHTLVRGLDYYTKTVFEIFEQNGKEKSSGALAGGGRYDNLVKVLGGPLTPGCGAAAGIERIVSLMKQADVRIPQPPQPKIFLAQLGTLAKRKSLKLIESFRKQKIAIAESLGRDSLKAQLEKANRMKVKYTLILGQKEALADQVIVKDMEKGQQDTIRLDKVVQTVAKKLN